LLCAIERGFCVVAVPRADHAVRVRDARTGEVVEGTLDARTGGIAGHWGNYPLTVARRIGANFAPPLAGVDMAFASDLPIAAGISSSSALVVATFLILSAANRLDTRAEYLRAIDGPDSLAEYLGAVENGLDYRSLKGERGVGTFGGSEDHTAILLSEQDRLAWYRYRPVTRLGAVALPADLTFVVGYSGVTAAKTGGARESYNRAATLVTALVGEWRKRTEREDPTLADALASGRDAVDRLRDIAAAGLPPFGVEPLQQRLEHFLIEDGVLVPAAIEALQSGRFDDLGRISDDSQRAAEQLLGNQVAETSALVRLARRHGALAASAFGAGFGGSVWALVPVADATRFTATWRTAYAAEHAQAASAASFFSTRPSQGAHAVE
jgi:galactokinase